MAFKNMEFFDIYVRNSGNLKMIAVIFRLLTNVSYIYSYYLINNQQIHLHKIAH